MIDKRIASIAAAMQGIDDGATVLLGGFGMVGHPTALIQGLVETGAKDLTIVANNAGFDRRPGFAAAHGETENSQADLQLPQGIARF